MIDKAREPYSFHAALKRLGQVSYLLFAMMGSFETLAEAATLELDIAQRWSVPLPEISGLSFLHHSVYFASDHDRDILALPFKPDDPLSLPADKRSLRNKRQSIAITLPSPAVFTGTSQWEGLAVDAKKQFFAVKETDSQIFQFGEDGKVVKTYKLGYWQGRRAKNKGLEGIVLLKNSHFLLALSKPSLLIEYGPSGDKAFGVHPSTVLAESDNFAPPAQEDLVALAQWTLQKPIDCQIGDIARGDKNDVIVLLKDCSLIARVPELDPAKGSFEATEAWKLPSEIFHAEGLLSLGKLGFLVAVDQKTDQKNLFWVKPK